MRTLYLIRHAQGSLGTDDYDRLSDLGLNQAQILGQTMQNGLSSEALSKSMLRGALKRHRQTAEAISDSPSVDVDADLNEYRVDGLLQAAFARSEALGIVQPSVDAMVDPKAYLNTFIELFPSVLQAWQEQRLECPMNGLWQAFHQRVQSSAQRIHSRMQSQPLVLAVTSAGVISTMAADLLGRDLVWQRALNIALYNASITELALDDSGRWQLKRLNCIAHLPDSSLHTLA